LFIKNLPENVTEEEIRALSADIQEIRIKQVKNVKNKKNKDKNQIKYGYVVVKTNKTVFGLF
jgi:RNA recognition motif-containing protein